MERAKEWSLEVENVYRLQEAGFMHLEEYRGFGLEDPCVWEGSGLLKKVPTKCSVEEGEFVYLFFSQRRECSDSHLHRVRLYRF